jgi:U3 small nucleolar RNA-associated protein 14
MVDRREGSGLEVASKQLLVVREAFAGDNVVEEFAREKAEVEARETVDDTPIVLPGTVYTCD